VQSVKVGKAVLVLNHHLTIEHRGLAAQLATRIDNPAISRRPVIAIPGEGAHLATIDDDQGAVAVVLDLMNPPFSGRWFRHQSWDFRLDEANLPLVDERVYRMAGVLDA
jgi:hypothetical protein